MKLNVHSILGVVCEIELHFFLVGFGIFSVTLLSQAQSESRTHDCFNEFAKLAARSSAGYHDGDVDTLGKMRKVCIPGTC